MAAAAIDAKKRTMNTNEKDTEGDTNEETTA